MFIMNPYRYAPSVAFIGLLDTYSGAYGAYSVRLLRSGFAGNYCMRVLRTGTSVEVDVHFDYTPIVPIISLNSEVAPAIGATNATTLGEFIAATGYANPDSISPASASIRSLYDQFTLVNVHQTSPSLQPQIASSGSLTTLNGHVAIYFNGTQYLTAPLSIGTLNNFSMFAVIQGTNTTGRSHSGFYESSTRFIRSVAQNGSSLLSSKAYAGSTLSTLFSGATALNEYAVYVRQSVNAGTTSILVHGTDTTATAVSATATATNTGTMAALVPIQIVVGAHRGNTYSGIIGYLSELFYYLDSASSTMSLATRNAILLNQIQFF